MVSNPRQATHPVKFLLALLSLSIMLNFSLLLNGESRNNIELDRQWSNILAGTSPLPNPSPHPDNGNSQGILAAKPTSLMPTTTRGGKLKIGMISGFVTLKPGPNAPRINKDLFGHMINKACYCDLHGYEYIFNTSWGFSKEEHKPWLDYGHWHKVPHMQAALPNYDWIVYADTDWAVQDLSLPLEALIRDLELHSKRSVGVYVPVDINGVTIFSNYVVMIRNNDFGRRLLQNWMDIGRGKVCQNGNFPIVPGKYNWGDSDQPGLWWALPKTHSEFSGNNFSEFTCNETSGLIQTKRFFGPEMRNYFKRVGVRVGSQGAELDQVPDDQYIIWSQLSNQTRSGLGLQKTYGPYHDADWPHAFAMHTKKPLSKHMHKDAEHCRSNRGCYAFYSDDGVFHVGCNNTLKTLGRQQHELA